MQARHNPTTFSDIHGPASALLLTLRLIVCTFVFANLPSGASPKRHDRNPTLSEAIEAMPSYQKSPIMPQRITNDRATISRLLLGLILGAALVPHTAPGLLHIELLLASFPLL